jgi:hypothetical protein
MKKIEWKIKLAYGDRFDEKAQVFVGVCPALGLVAQGRSREEARNVTFQMIKSYLSVHHRRGSLDRALADQGFQDVEIPEGAPVAAAAAEPDEFISYHEVYEKSFLEIPYSLISSSLGMGHAGHPAPSLVPA